MDNVSPRDDATEPATPGSPSGTAAPAGPGAGPRLFGVPAIWVALIVFVILVVILTWLGLLPNTPL